MEAISIVQEIDGDYCSGTLYQHKLLPWYRRLIETTAIVHETDRDGCCSTGD